MATSVILTGTSLGADVGPFNIYHTSEIAGNLIESGVSRASLDSGWYTSQIYPTYIVRSTGACTNAVTVLVTTPIPTATPTPTPTPQPAEEFYSLQRCIDSSFGFRTANLTSSITLSVGDRVEDSAGLFYVVTGTTNSISGNVGTVTDTGLTGCPETPPEEYQASVTTLAADPVGTDTATMNGTITDVGEPAYTTKGFVYLQGTGTPIIGVDTNVPVAGTGLGNFSANLTGLTPGTQYTYRAYAINTVGTTYGDNRTIDTNLVGYYQLQNCTTLSTNHRSGQTIEDITLANNDRVTAGGVTYIVVGTTTNASIPSVGTVTNTFLVGCPATVRYYNMSLCSDPNVQFVGVNNSSENLANGSSLENNGTCYQVGTETTTSGLDTNITTWTRYNNCAACFAVNPTPTPTPTPFSPTPTPTPSPTPAGVTCYEYDLESGGTGTTTYFNYTCCDGTEFTNVPVGDQGTTVCAREFTVSITSGPGQFFNTGISCSTSC